MSSKSRSRSRSDSRSPKYSRRRSRDDSMSPIRTASGASLRTPKNYNSANRNYGYNNNNYGYRNYGYNNNRGYYNQRGYYQRWGRGRGNWRGQYNQYNNRNQWNDRRRYSRSERSRSRSRSYDSRDSRSHSSSSDRSRSRSREKRRRRTRSKSDRRSKSHSPPPKTVETPKEVKKVEEPKPPVTVPSTTEVLGDPEPEEEEPEQQEKPPEPQMAESSSSLTRSRWETPDSPKPEKKKQPGMDLSNDEIFDRWDDDKLREYLLKSKGEKVLKDSQKSAEPEKFSGKKKKRRSKSSVSSPPKEKPKIKNRTSESSDSSTFSPIHKIPEKTVIKQHDTSEKYNPETQDYDDQIGDMQEDTPPYFDKNQKMETVQYPFGHIKSHAPLPAAAPLPTAVPQAPSHLPPPVPPPTTTIPSINEMQVLGPDGTPMRMVPTSIPGPDGRMIQVMQLQPIQTPAPVEPPKPPQRVPAPPTTYPPPQVQQRSYHKMEEPKYQDDESEEEEDEDRYEGFPFSTDNHVEKTKIMERQSKKVETTKSGLTPQSAANWMKDDKQERSSGFRKENVSSVLPTFPSASSVTQKQFTHEKDVPQSPVTATILPAEPVARQENMDWQSEKVKNQKPSEPEHKEVLQPYDSHSISKEKDSVHMEEKEESKQSSDEEEDRVKRKKEKKKKKKNKKKDDAKKKKKKHKEKSVEKMTIASLENETIKSKKDLKDFEELNKKSKEDNLLRVVSENLPISHVRGIIPRKKGDSEQLLFQHIVDEDLSMSSSYEDRFVSLFGSSEPEKKGSREQKVDLTKKSVRKFKVNISEPRAVGHMTGIPLSERISKLKDDTEDAIETNPAAQKVSLKVSEVSKRDRSSPSRSRSRSISSSASSESPKKKKKRKSRKSSSTSRSRSRSLPAAYGGDDDSERRNASRDRYSRSPSSSGDERDRGRRQAYYNRNNQGYYYNNNRNRGFYQNRNRGWYNNRGGYRGRWNNNWNQGWNRNQNWRNQRYSRDRYNRSRSRSRDRSRSRSSSRDDRRSKSPKRERTPEKKAASQELNKEKQNIHRTGGESVKSDANKSAGADMFHEERPPGVD